MAEEQALGIGEYEQPEIAGAERLCLTS